MKTKIILSLLLLTINLKSFSKVWTISNSGFTFSPSILNINVGDSVNLVLSSNHDGREVNQMTWNANGITPLGGGFQTPLGGGMILPSQLFVGTHYYVCSIHASLGMKGTIVVNSCTAPIINSINALNVNCNGVSTGSITINANGTPGPLQYSINGGSTFQPGNIFSNLGMGNYLVVVSDLNGCTKSSQAAITSPAPISVSTFVNQFTCNGNPNGSITINAGGGIGPFQFSINNGVNFQAGNFFNNLAANTYFVIVKDANGCTKSTTAVVNTPSVIILSVQTTSASCGNINGSISVIANGGTSPYQYSINNGTTLQAGNTFNSLAAGSYTVVAIDANGCTKSGIFAVSNVSLLVITTAILGDTINCAGSIKSYSISPVLGAASYLWSLPGGWIGASSTNTISATTGTIGGIISVTAVNTCGSSTPRTLNVVVNNVPATPGSIATTGGSLKVCPGDTRIYTVANVAGVTWNWVVPNGATINSGQGTRSINVTYNSGFIANGILSVVAVNNCGNSLARSLTIARNVAATPGVITGTFFGLCNQTNVSYNVPLVNGVTYNWIVPASASIASGQNTNAITVNFPITSFTGSLIVTANNACGASAQRKTNLASMPATPTVITGATAVCANQIGVPYSIAPIATALTYTWTGPTGSHISDGINTSVSNVMTTTATAVTVNYGATAGSLKVKANNSCASGGSKTIAITIVCRTESITEANEFKLFPNPTDGNVSMKFYAGENQNYQLTLFDITGRTILNQQIIAIKGDNNYSLDLKNFPSGIYLVKLQSNYKTITQRIIKVQI